MALLISYRQPNGSLNLSSFKGFSSPCGGAKILPALLIRLTIRSCRGQADS